MQELHLKHRKSSRIVNRITEIQTDGGLPKTGQNMSRYPYDDGYYQIGHPINWGQRFVDNGNGTVTDMATGLIWVKDPAAAGFGSPMDWYMALDACEMLNYAGYNDWRLPNVFEIASINDYGRYDPAQDTSYFVPCPDQWGVWWSSTICAPWTDGAWAVYAYDGYLTTYGIIWGDQCYVRPVRGGQS